MEDRAGEILANHGYRAIAQHPEIKYVWTINGQERNVTVTPDWLVRKDGLTYLVEVKTGDQAKPESSENTPPIAGILSL